MAQKVVHVISCDACGKEQGRTVALPGSREIDLCEECEDQLDAALAPYMERSRKVRPAQAPGARVRVDIAEVRGWARQQGYNVSARGRVAKQIIEAYLEAR